MPNETDLKKLFGERLAFLDKRQTSLLKDVTEMEARLLDVILKTLYAELVIKRGLIDSSNNPISLTVAIERVFDLFIRKKQLGVVNTLVGDLDQIFDYNDGYYELFTTNKRRYAAVSRETRSLMRSKLGLTLDNHIKPNSYIDQLTKSLPLKNTIRETLYKAIARQAPIKETTEAVRLLVTGTPNVDGGLVKYYKGFVYDTYTQYDRASNNQLAQRLELKYFIYAGGLIETSRKFCIKRDGKMFTRKEAQRTFPKDPSLPRTVAERESGILIGYNAIEDLGRWNCRHLARFISKEAAEEYQPSVTKVPLEKRVIVGVT